MLKISANCYSSFEKPSLLLAILHWQQSDSPCYKPPGHYKLMAETE